MELTKHCIERNITINTARRNGKTAKMIAEFKAIYGDSNLRTYEMVTHIGRGQSFPIIIYSD